MQQFVGLSGVVEFAGRDPQPFLMHIPCTRADAVAADIGVMNGRAHIGDQPAVHEDPAEHGDIEEMSRRDPGVVGDQHIAFHQLVGKAPGQCETGSRQRIDVPGRARVGLRHHPPAHIEQSRSQIARLAHDRAEGDALQRLGLFGDDADQVRPEDFALDAVHCLNLRGFCDDAPGLAEFGVPAWMNDDGGLTLLDDGGAGYELTSFCWPK